MREQVGKTSEPPSFYIAFVLELPDCPSMDFNSDQRKVMSVTVSLYALHPEHKSYLGTRTRITPATL